MDAWDYETGIGRLGEDFSGGEPVSLTRLGDAISMPAMCQETRARNPCCAIVSNPCG
jgi:hypothetical protein